MIVPARDVVGTLGDTLAGLAALELPPGVEMELLVVDNGSRDATAEIAAAAGARVLRRPRGAGPGAARNDGAAAARGDVLAFLDADCMPTRSWLAAALAALERGADLVQGPVAPDPVQPFAPWDRSLWVHGPTGLFESANLVVTREAFARAGGFPPGLEDPARGAPFGEDALFGWAARRAGARTAWAPDARVHHAVFPRTPRRFVADKARLALFPRLVAREPGLRETLLTARVFLSKRTAAVDLALLGAAAAVLTRRWAPLLLAAPYARALARAPRRAPVHLAADLTAALALVRGSLRERTPVL